MHNFEELKVWQKAMELAQKIYEGCKDLPAEERYGLSSQMRRSAVSIPSNIAEGAGRNSDKDFIRFLSITHGSAFELQTQLIISKRVGLLSSEFVSDSIEMLKEIQRMNYSLQKSLG